MSSCPDYALGTTFDFHFTTRRFSTGAPFTLAGTPVLSAYPDNSDTELTAGITLTADKDSRTGLNLVRIVATSGNGYASGSHYSLVITTGTVDSISVVGEVVYEFTIEKQSALRPTTAGRTLVVDASGLADANTVKLGPTGAGTAQTAGDVGIKTGFALTSAYDFAKGTVAMTEAYAANAAAPTPVQAFFAMHQMLMQFSITTTSLTVKKLDNATTAFVVTLNDATSPTSAVRT